MSEIWVEKIKEAYYRLETFFKTKQSNSSFDVEIIPFMNNVNLLRKASEVSLAKGMTDVVTGKSTSVNGVLTSNIELMKNGILMLGKTDPISGDFLKSNFVLSINTQRQVTPDVYENVTIEFHTRKLINYLITNYTSSKDPNMAETVKESKKLWFDVSACIAVAFIEFIDAHCTNIVSAEDRRVIRSKIISTAFKVPKFNAPSNNQNILLLAKNIIDSKMGKEFIESLGTDPDSVKHVLNNVVNKVPTIDINSVKDTISNAMSTGEPGTILTDIKDIVLGFSDCIPHIKGTKSAQEQD